MNWEIGLMYMQRHVSDRQLGGPAGQCGSPAQGSAVMHAGGMGGGGGPRGRGYIYT